MTQQNEPLTLQQLQEQLNRLYALLPATQQKEGPAAEIWADIEQLLHGLRQTIPDADTAGFPSAASVLYEGSQRIARALNEQEIYTAFFEQIRRYDPCEISLFQFKMVEDEPIWAELQANWQKNNASTYPPQTRLYLPDHPHHKLLTTREPLFIDDVAADSRLSDVEQAAFTAAGICSVALLPLTSRGYGFGVAPIYFTRPFTFTDLLRQVWVALANQVGASLVNQQFIQKSAYRAMQMDAAAKVAQASGSIFNLQELLDTTVELIRNHFDLYYAGVFLVDQSGEWAVLRAGTGEAGRRQIEAGHRLKIGGESMIGWSIVHRQARIALDVGQEAVHFRNPYLPDTHSEMALPLIHRDRVIGALTIQSVEQAAFSQEDITFLEIIANQLAVAIENARLFTRLADSEARYRELVENANSIIFRMNTRGEVTFFNEFAQNFFGYSEAEILGKDVVGTIVPKTDTAGRDLANMIRDIAKHPEAYASNVNENIRRDGKRVWISWTNKAIRNKTGQITEILCVGNDITELRRAEEQLREMLAKTEALGRIGHILATMSDQQTVFETFLKEYLTLLKLKQGGIILLDPAQTINQLAATYVDGKLETQITNIPVETNPLLQYMVEHPTPLLIEDVYTHPLTQNNSHIHKEVVSVLLMPLIVKNKLVGLLAAHSSQKDYEFTPDHIRTGEVVAGQLSIWLEKHQLLEEIQRHFALLQTAAEVSRAASSILNVDQLIQTSVDLIRDHFDFYYVGLFLVDQSGEWAVLRAGTGEAGRRQIEAGHRLKIGGESMIGWSIAHRQARIALDVGEEAVHFRNPYLPDTHSEMALPLISRDEVIGALTVQSVERAAFSDEDITVLQTMADQLANAITNARLFEDARRAQQSAETLLRETQALHHLSEALAGTLRTNEILDIFFQACTQEIGFEYVVVSLVDKPRNRIRAIAGVGVTESHIKRANRSLDSNDIMADIIRTGQTEVITGWDDRFDRDTFEAEGHADWVRLFTPIILRRENIGLVEAGFNKKVRQTITDLQIRLMRAFIDQTALALENARRYEASQRAARREALIKEITTKVRASSTVDKILQTTVKEVGDALGGKRAYVHLASPAQKDNNGSN